MEKFLEAARLAWNPISEVRRRLKAGNLSVPAVLVPVVAALVACNLFSTGGLELFWDTALNSIDPNVPKLGTNTFIVHFASTLGALVTVAVLGLIPARVFQPYGRSATAAALLIVTAAQSFYSAAISAPAYFVAGSLAYDDVQLGLRAFQLLNFPLAFVVLGLTIFFWSRISLSVLDLSAPRMMGITLMVILGFAVVLGAFALLASASGLHVFNFGQLPPLTHDLEALV